MALRGERTTTSYIYDGWDIVQERQDDQVKWNYLRSLNIDEPLARIGFDNTTEYYHADHLGTHHLDNG